MLTNILIGLYFIIAFIFHPGIYNEWKKDTDPDMARFSPIFIQIALVGSALLWPVLVLVVVVQKIKEKK
jgi:formate-dependent nitrite reductase membrane component NrfD